MTQHTIRPYHIPPDSPRPDRPAWTRANDIGMDGERAVADLLIGIGLAAAKMQDRCADLEIFGKIEVKSDQLALTTGSVAVEVAFRGRPSGIMASCATCWAYVVGRDIIMVSAARLRDAIGDLPDRPAGENAVIRLLRLDTLRNIGISVRGGR